MFLFFLPAIKFHISLEILLPMANIFLYKTSSLNCALLIFCLYHRLFQYKISEMLYFLEYRHNTSFVLSARSALKAERARSRPKGGPLDDPGISLFYLILQIKKSLLADGQPKG